jgi:hypothetical protein
MSFKHYLSDSKNSSNAKAFVNVSKHKKIPWWRVISPTSGPSLLVAWYCLLNIFSVILYIWKLPPSSATHKTVLPGFCPHIFKLTFCVNFCFSKHAIYMFCLYLISEYKLWCPSLYTLPHPLLLLSFKPKYSPQCLFSNTLSLCSSFRARENFQLLSKWHNIIVLWCNAISSLSNHKAQGQPFIGSLWRLIPNISSYSPSAVWAVSYHTDKETHLI